MINLTELRELATAEALSNDEFNLVCDAIPALIDAVEAAQEIAHCGHLLASEYTFKPLRDALARFEFP